MTCWVKYFPVFVLVNRFELVGLVYPDQAFELALHGPSRLVLMYIRRIVSRETFRVPHAE